MSLPPQILRIKRKRDEDPVDSLYLESRQQNEKRRHTEHAYVFRRLVQDSASTAPPKSARLNVPSQAAEVQSSSNHTNSLVNSNVRPSSTGIPEKTLKSATPSPRRFTLSRDAIVNLMNKSRNGMAASEEPSIAVFVETKDTELAEPLQKTDASAHVQQTSISPRKRPGVSATSARSRQVVDPSSSSNVSDATYLAMRKYASELEAADPNAITATAQTPADPDAMDTSGDDFIYDTYVRHSTEENAGAGIDSVAGHQEGPVGVLVIPDEDMTLWEQYYDSDADSDDEADWDSEQDDENAENFYGADYPEDEVDSDDEMDGNPYRYHRGSDDEEYGSDDDDFSDSDEPHVSWEEMQRRDLVG